MKRTNLKIKIVALYATATFCALLAQIQFLQILWAVYVPLVTAANILLFDEFIEFIDFSDIKALSSKDRGMYILSVAVLSGSFAVASALFLR